MNDRLKTNVGSVELRNPILLASGIVANGKEYSEIIDFSRIGGIVTKTITIDERIGNKPPRLWETDAGMLNSIGLENEGFDNFIEKNHDFLKRLDCAVILSIAGSTDDDFIRLAEKVDNLDFPAAIEANFSCPNVSQGGISYGTSIDGCYDTVKQLKGVITNKPLWVKLSPQVADIGMIAFSAKKAGADAITAINTVPALEIDAETLKPRLGNIIGGLSGTAIRPIALKAIYDIVKRLKGFPLVGIGGIIEPEDTVKFISLGAQAVQIGSGLFGNPELPYQTIDFLLEYFDRHDYKDINEICGDFWRKNGLEE
ncbi:MAG: dihydroorotate dehydrogenase [Candidatus Zixiibacteriota bacterium]